jgi:LPS-assembly lipoprotein
MLLFSRRTLLSLPLVLAACGFTPVYGPGGSGQILQDNVSTSEPVTRNDFLLNQRLEERLGRVNDAPYLLSVSTSIGVGGLAVDTAGTTTRFNIVGTSQYSLTERATGRIVTSGAVDNFTSYSASGTTIATRAASRDAQERLMVILADDIVTRLFGADLQ